VRRGVLLAGGNATRLRPLTAVTSKQLLPVYDKPLIYYPLTTLMLAGIREILLISNRHHILAFQELLGDGSQWGLSIEYKEQENPNGVAESLVLAKNFLSGLPSALVLGDNLFHGTGLGRRLSSIPDSSGAVISAYRVSDPRAFGVVDFDSEGKVLSLEEKPEHPKSNWVVPGLYFYDATAPDRASQLKPSARGELEITDLNLSYLQSGNLFAEKLSRGTTWLDMGTADSLLDAAEYVRMIQNRQGTLVGSPEEVSWRQGWISDTQLASIAQSYKSLYGDALARMLRERN
jgi:glucose-1-phosphate thymidylyltransferase